MSAELYFEWNIHTHILYNQSYISPQCFMGRNIKAPLYPTICIPYISWGSPFSRNVANPYGPSHNQFHVDLLKERFHLRIAVVRQSRDGDRWRLLPAVERFHYDGSAAELLRIRRSSSLTYTFN